MLTDLQCRKAQPRDRPYKMADASGLYLHVATTGYRAWRFKYRIAGVEKLLTFGAYPEVTLQNARDLRDDARKLIRDGIDPVIDRKQRAAAHVFGRANTFEIVATRWHKQASKQLTPRYAGQVESRLKENVYPTLGALPITAITPPMVLELLRKIESRGANEMAHRVRQHMSAVFVFAIGEGICTNDPARVVQSALVRTVKKRRPAVRSIKAARAILMRIEQEGGARRSTMLASRLLALTAARPGVVRLAEWPEFEGLETDEPIWRIPAEKMKMTRERKEDVTNEFIVPLSRQAVDLVLVAREWTKPGKLIFPSDRGAERPMSLSTLSKLYRESGFDGVHVPHGWRSTFSTLMNEQAAKRKSEADRAVIDLMLAHQPPGVESVYNRFAYLDRRRELAQEWADMLDQGLRDIRTVGAPMRT